MSLPRRLSATGKPATAPVTAPVRTPASAATGGTERYLVRYSPGTDVASEARALRARGLDVRPIFGHTVKAAVLTASPAQAAAVARSPRVQAVEVDARVQATATQDTAPWGLDRVDQRNLPRRGA